MRAGESRLKDDRSPVTEADERAEALILAGLAERLPGWPVLAEEAAARGEGIDACARFILVDPLDGTREFLNRNGEFTVNIGLVADGVPVAGAVYAPVLERLWSGGARRGSGASRPAAICRRPVEDRATADPRRAPAADWTALASRSHGDAETEALLARLPIGQRRAAGSSLKFCVVAEGEADVYPAVRAHDGMGHGGGRGRVCGPPAAWCSSRTASPSSTARPRRAIATAPSWPGAIPRRRSASERPPSTPLRWPDGSRLRLRGRTSRGAGRLNPDRRGRGPERSPMHAALIAATAALGGLLFGYDTGVISGALLFLRDAFQLSPLMQGVVTSIALLGAAVGRGFAGSAVGPLRPAAADPGDGADLRRRIARLGLRHRTLDAAGRSAARRPRHRRLLHAGAALPVGDRAGREARRHGVAEPADDHNRDPGVLSHRLRLRRRRRVALDAGPRRAAGRDPRRRHAGAAGIAALARRPRPCGGCAPGARGAARLERDGAADRGRTRQDRGRPRPREAPRGRHPAVRPEPAAAADRRRRPRDLPAGDGHQHGHLFRPDDLPGGRPLLRLGVDPRHGGGRGRQRRHDAGGDPAHRPRRAPRAAAGRPRRHGGEPRGARGRVPARRRRGARDG